MKKQMRAHEERNVKAAPEESEPGEAVPAYLLDRSNPQSAKALSSAIKNKRAEKAARFSVPLPKVRGISEEEMFKVVNTGKKTKKKGWKRVVTQPVCPSRSCVSQGTCPLFLVRHTDYGFEQTFVGAEFTRRNPKYERFVRPMGLRYKKAHVTHPELKVTVQLPIIAVKKNPNSPLSTQLGVLSKGTVVEVDVSDLGLVTASGKVVWARYAQVTNNPSNDGCVNA